MSWLSGVRWFAQVLVFVVLWFGTAPAAHAQSKVAVKGGAILVGGKKVPAAKPYRDAVGLPDGTVLAVRDSGVEVDSAMGPVDAGVVVRVDPKSGAETVLLEGRKNEDAEATLVDLDGIVASPDGTTVYVFAKTIWPSLGGVWAMKPDGRGAKFFAPSGIRPSVVQKGPWKGHLLATQQLHFAEGGIWFPPVLLEPGSGRVVGLCRKPPEGKGSLEADLHPYVPLTALTLNEGAQVPKERD
jgi:hypothetical protein